MNNKGVGSIFCFMSALFMCVRYLSASIFMSGVSSWSAGLFSSGLSYVGAPLMVASIISLIVGILFLAYGVYQDWKKENASD